ncbi:membrane protein insertase YidC [Leucothrix mucor]|uniref:membrane protein insertase YidC n=1 Tax=Leucothrix mucor TaxID=45248 RepID=UPI0003B35C44|nr:membrane protein insertase YidC [Leucothrix mucor]
MEQQRPLLYLMLAFIAFMIWSSWQERNAPPVSSAPTTQVTTAGNVANQADVPQSPNLTSASVAGVPTTNAVTGKNIRVKTDVLDLQISLTGGTVLQADLLTYPVSLDEPENPVRVLDVAKTYAAQSGLVASEGDPKLAPNHYAEFSTEKSEYILEGDTLEVPLVWRGENGLTVTKTFTFKRGKFLVDVQQTLNNQSGNAWNGIEYHQITHGTPESQGIGLGTVSYVGGAYYDDKYVKVDFGDIESENLKKQIKGGWAAMLEHYFISAWIPGPDSLNTYETLFIPERSSHILRVSSPSLSVPDGKAGIFKSQFYVGPKIQKNLEAMSPGLDLTVDYGIFSFVSKPIFWIMNRIQSVVSNWGWTIILMTILIKLFFFWPSAISYRSMAKMKKLGPKIKEINEKHKADPQAKQKATMDFYRKEKINPLGGCLPILIQMPVFMGLYWVLLESVELRQAPWIMWFKDLSVMDPYYVLPLLMGASMYIQQRLNPPQMTDPMQQKIFQFLPVVFTVMFLFFPAGLVLYWVVNNVLSIAQQYVITKRIVGDDAPVLS